MIMEVSNSDTAVVFVDPQNDVLMHEAWGSSMEKSDV
jgi:hypothetical protein